MKEKIYEPVREFERQTTYCPLYLAWHVLDETRDYFRTPIPEAFADKLARRAEAVFAHNPFWQRRFKGVRGHDEILAAMRHWLAGVLAMEQPALFRQLPESFKIGHPLPASVGGARSPLHEAGGKPNVRRRARSDALSRHFVHGCELLTI